MENIKKPTPEEIAAVKGKGFLIDKTTFRHFNARVLTVNGRVTSEQMNTVSECAKLFGNGYVTLTSRMTFEIQHIPFENIEPMIAYLSERGMKTGGTGPKVRPIVSCKGTTCQYGLIDTFALSERIHEEIFEGYSSVRLPHKFKIAVGGCPNSCAKPDLNDLGIVGQKVVQIDYEKCKGCKACQIEKSCPIKCAKVENGKINVTEECNHCGRCAEKCPFGAFDDYVSAYKIFIGGRWGKKTSRGIPLSKLLYSENEVLSAVESAVLFFKDKGNAGERFSDTISRVRIETAEKEILSGELIKRKAEIINK